MAQRIDDQEFPIPALLRQARGSYGRAIAQRLAQEGFDDVPANGPFVLGGLARDASSVAFTEGLGVSKQAVSQLLDTLVLRGYLTRDIDPADRRRMVLGLTDRGTAAAAAVRDAVATVDAELSAMISPAELAGLRAGLTALGKIKRDRDAVRR